MKQILLLSLCLCVTFSFADEYEEESDLSSQVSIGGSGFIMFGQIGSGHSHSKNKANPIDHHWQNFYGGRLDAVSTPAPWFTTKISLELGSAWPVLRESTIMKETFKLQYRPILPQAVGLFNFKVADAVDMEIESGMMEYAFNPDVKNLGNYLHRTAANPTNITTKLDYIYSNLMGIRVQGGFMENKLKVGAMINSTIHQSPFFDMDLTFYAQYTNDNKFVDGALGIVFERAMPIDKELTLFEGNRMKSQLGDTTATLRGTVLNGRVTLDPKKLLQDQAIFGEEDLKVYLEGAVLGFKDFDFYPSDSVFTKLNMFNRLPLMFGINIPTFKILDVLSFELEYFNYPYANDWWGDLSVPSPKPVAPPSDVEWQDIYRNKDNIKWSFYLKKSISKFDIIAFIANDHIRYETYNAESQWYTEQSLRESSDWHWYIKLQCHL